MLKDYLSQKGIQYTDKDVTIDPSAGQEMVTRTGQRGVPVTIIDGQTIIGFDVPKLDQALSQTQSARPSFGATIADADKITVAQGTASTFGAYIGRVRPGSTAEKLGLVSGDIITEISGQYTGSAADMENILSRFKTGDKISLSFRRGGQTLTAEGFYS
jgi:glutaredoxin 3